jgi:hypothetical protein
MEPQLFFGTTKNRFFGAKKSLRTSTKNRRRHDISSNCRFTERHKNNFYGEKGTRHIQLLVLARLGEQVGAKEK